MNVTMPIPTNLLLRRAKEQLGRGEYERARQTSLQAYEEATVWHPDQSACVQALRSLAICYTAEGDYEAAYRILSMAYMCAAYDQSQQGRIVEAVAETVKSWRLYKQALAMRRQFDLLLRSQPPAQVRRFSSEFLTQARGEGEDHWYFGFAMMLEAVALTVSREDGAVKAFEAAAEIAGAWGYHVQWLTLNIKELRTTLRCA